MKTRMPFQPAFDLRRLVRGVIVQDQMNLQVGGDLVINRFEKLDPLLMPMPLRAMGKNFTLQIIQGGKQSQCAMTIVIVGARGDVSLAQRQTGLASFQRLALAFLIAAQYDRLLWRWQKQTDNIPKLLLELLIVGQF